MTRHERLSAILDIVVEEGAVRIEDVMERLNVSAATARRDLDVLASQQLITRTRGGASAIPSSSQLPLRYRSGPMGAQKKRIAQAAAAMVRPGDTIGLNGGTTTTEVAHEIAVLPGVADGSQQVTVVTNAVNIASELTVRQSVRVVVTGGVARAQSYELTGPLSQLILPAITVGTLFLGVEGIDAMGTYAQHEGEAAVNAALVRAARTVVVVADHRKLGVAAFARICSLQHVSCVITDDDAPHAAVEQLRSCGVEVRTV